MLETLGTLNELAKDRRQSLAQMALAWVLKDSRVSSVIVGASSVEQLKTNIDSVRNTSFSEEELSLINTLTR